MKERIRRWLCAHGWHKVKTVKIMVGGDGPDDSAALVECCHCHMSGYRYCDGTVRLR